MILNDLNEAVKELRIRLEQETSPETQERMGPLLKLAGRIENALAELRRDFIDVREFCHNYHQALCITDGSGRIVYMNQKYMDDTMLTAADLGKKEPFQVPISKEVIEKKRTVTFGNDGSRLGLAHGRYVAAIPIFDESGEIRNIVITLSPEEEVYRRYRDMAGLVNQKEAVRILESGAEGQMRSLLGKNASIKETRRLIKRVAPTKATVLITGESGSGKEVVADCIYEMSDRKEKPYVKINCSAIPPNLLEAELFGYEKGAFTGANSRKIGLLEVANHGTILLDEIGDFPLELQPKLLRVLQQGEMYRIGCTTPIKLDVRIIAATNANLKRRITEGLFREDLFYRVSVFPIHLPPIRERREDIRGLASHFFYVYCQKYKRTLWLLPEILELLERYSWPGNVREMQNVIEYYVICSEEGNELSVTELARVLRYGGTFSSEPGPCDESAEPPSALDDSCVIETDLITEDAPERWDEAAELMDPSYPEPEGSTLFEKRDNYEKHLIMDALKRASSARQAAKLLGIFPSSLYRKAQKYGIDLTQYGIPPAGEE